MNPHQTKRLMAAAGIFWLVYLIIHMLANLNFLTGADNFNGFYIWFNEAVILRWFIIVLLVASILLHVFVAVQRQWDSHCKRTINYKKPYPKGVPRLLAWSGALILLAFIVLHFVQMQLLSSRDFYQEIRSLFADPIMLGIYALGFTALAAHLHHALTNVRQTFGLTHRQQHRFITAFVFILVGGFTAIPLSLYL